MVLLHALHRLAGKLGLLLAVAHFNHRLRGRASDADEAFVRKEAESMDLAFVSEQADVKGFARRQKLSLEMAARQLRHEFLARTCARLGMSSVALAHHADDQVELFFLRLLRGAGGEGLSGMAWTSPSPCNSSIQLIRPLLNLRKDELKVFAGQHNIAFREDASNAQLKHQRNRIRHELLPLLESSFQPGLSKVIPRVMDIVEKESDFVSKAARLWKVKPGSRTFDKLHAAVQRRLIQMDLIELGVPPGFDLIERLRGSVGEIIMVNPELALWRDDTGALRSRRVSEFRFNAKGTVLDLTLERGRTVLENLEIQWRIQPWHRTTASSGTQPSACEQFDAQKVGSPVLLRHWRPGDRFQPIGMPHAIKVQDLFTNAKIPRARRHQLLLATTALGEIFWIEGLRLSERFKLDEHTQSSLKWQWRRDWHDRDIFGFGQ